MHNSKDNWYLLVRLWVRRSLKHWDFIQLATAMDRKDDAMCLVYRYGNDRAFNRTVAAAFLHAARKTK